MENNTNKQNADGLSTCWSIAGHLSWIFPCVKMGAEYHLLPYCWWIYIHIKPDVGDAEHLFIISCHDVFIIGRHDFIINVHQVHHIGVVNIASQTCITLIGWSRGFPSDHDSVAMSTTGESACKRIGTNHYQNWLGWDRQNPCRLGVNGNRSGWCRMTIVKRDHHEYDPKRIFGTWDFGLSCLSAVQRLVDCTRFCKMVLTCFTPVVHRAFLFMHFMITTWTRSR